MLRITRDMQIELARYNAGIERARRDYYGTQPKPCGCSVATACKRHRAIAAADLRVATSEDECARLLAILDRPSPPCANRCGRARDGRHLLCWGCRRTGGCAS